jgi:quercetin dioxygenase-like cupin family protein
MTLLRSPDLQVFLTMAEAAIRHQSAPDGPIPAAADRIFSALQTSAAAPGQSGASRLPVCRHLDRALERVASEPGPVGALADAFASLRPQLGWKTRSGAEAFGEPFLSGHANAMLVGEDGLEDRDDVRIGVSLLAPQIRYPNHRHPPEEVYVVMSEGEWRQGDGSWHEPGIGGLVYNPPNIVHAMRSATQPLLALWFLWAGA